MRVCEMRKGDKGRGTDVIVRWERKLGEASMLKSMERKVKADEGRGRQT